MASLIPVSPVIISGIGMPGFTRLDHSLTPWGLTWTMPISVMRSRPAWVPVVSRSMKAIGTLDMGLLF